MSICSRHQTVKADCEACNVRLENDPAFVKALKKAEAAGVLVY